MNPWKCPDCGVWIAGWVREHRCQIISATGTQEPYEPKVSIQQTYPVDTAWGYSTTSVPCNCEACKSVQGRTTTA